MEKRAEILNRYSRQMLIPNFGLSGQEKLLSSKVLVVGAGGIGSSASPEGIRQGSPPHW